MLILNIIIPIRYTYSFKHITYIYLIYYIPKRNNNN